MKKPLTILAALALVILCATLLPTEAQAASESNLTFTLNSDGQSYSVTDCNSSASGSLSIPATYNGKPVTSIGESAFSSCKSLTSVTIPDSVTSIGEEAFYSCYKLTSVTIGDSVTSIGDYAFSSTKLTSITIPDSVTSIGDRAFYSCSSLTGIWVDTNNAVYSSDVKGVLFDKNKTVLMKAPGAISGIYCIPSTVTSIGERAFYNCDSLTSVTIGDSVTNIGNSAFSSCDSLTSVTIPDSVISIGSDAFIGCVSLTSVTIGNGVTSIGNSAFSNCTKLTSITIPDSVTSIGSQAFYNCTSLTSVTIPDSVTSIGEDAFLNCDSLTYNEYDNAKYLGNSTNPYVVLINATSTNITSCKIHDETRVIYDEAFRNCTYLTSVTIPDSVTSIGSNTFSGCTALSYYVCDNAKYLGNATHPYVLLMDVVSTSCSNITIPSSVNYIHPHAFDDCDKLSAVFISDLAAWCNIHFSYTSEIVDWMLRPIFEDYYGTPMYYGAKLYLNGELVTDIVIPNSITRINDYAFMNCKSLTSVTIPDSVTSIGDSAFYSCDSLTNVTYCGTEEQWNRISIGSNNETLAGSQRSYHNWEGEATCTTQQVCTVCGQQEYGHVWIDATCTSLKYCFLCGITDGTEYGHEWIAANCTKPKTCSSCGATEGTIQHSWIDAACTTAKTCSVCGITEGEALGHSWVAATCTTPKNCTSCGATEGAELGHSWTSATCTTPKTCTTCGQTEGGMQHNWVAATCTAPKTCSLCSTTVGTALGHSWQNATCLKPKHCTVCGVTEGTITDHTYSGDSDAFCNVCNHQRILSAPSLKFYGTPGLSFQEYIGIQVLITNQSVEDYDEVYAVTVQQTPDGDVTGTTYGIPYATNYTIFEQQIVSWSMTEQVTMTLYGKKDGVVYQGVTITTSVKNLAENKLAAYKAQGNAKVCRALVDMLNYGAAVQTYYNYNAENLPNVDIAQYLSYGSTNTPELTATNSVTGTGTVTVYGDNISLQDKVEFNLMFYNADLVGKEVRATVGGETVDVFYNTELAPGWTIARVAVETSKMREVYTIALYDEEGNAVSQIYNVSVEGYAKARAGTAKAVVDVAMMRYGDAVRALLP